MEGVLYKWTNYMTARTTLEKEAKDPSRCPCVRLKMQRSISHPGTYSFDRSGVLKEFVGGGQRSQRRNRTCSDSSLYDAEQSPGQSFLPSLDTWPFFKKHRLHMKADLEQAEQRNLQLVGEVDERHACMETLNHSRIRELQQDFRERVQCVRSEAEQENEALLEKGERERASLQEELRLLREKELQLEEELSSTSQESRRLEEDLRAFGSLDPAAAGLSHEERFSQIVKDYELQLRELRDRNDELSSEVELLKNQRSEKKSRRSAGDAPNWTQQHNSDESDMKRGASPPARKKLQPSDKTGALWSGAQYSDRTCRGADEDEHNEDLQQLHIQLETQMEISEVEEQKSQVEQQRERADLEQNFAREIGNLVKSLRDEKDELEAELQLKMDRETMLLRTQLEEARSENNSGYREEVLLLSSRNLQLSNENAELSSLLHGDQESVRMLRERLATVAKEQEDGGP
ncbi:hypothetical protein F7725_023586, partial [Dissostichus mawsoni]